MKPNAYIHSTLLSTLEDRKRKNLPLRLAFLDIDSTLTGNKRAVNQVREILEDEGYVLIFVSARTEEIMMSSTAYKKSVSLGFPRPKPLLLETNGKHTYVPPEEFMFPDGNLLDPDVIAGSTGTQIYLKQQNRGYLRDEKFYSLLRNDQSNWRRSALELITTVNKKEKLAELSPFEYEENYKKGLSNVYPPELRIEIVFSKLRNKKRFTKRFHRITKENRQNLKLVDDSHPRQRLYKMFVMPVLGGKARAVDYMIDQIARLLKVKKDSLELLIAGDGLPDLRMGLVGGAGTQVTFIIVGDARITQLVIDNVGEFAGEKVELYKKRLSKLKSKSQTIMPGRYEYQTKFGKRLVIVGDEAYPGKKGPETILEYLQKS